MGKERFIIAFSIVVLFMKLIDYNKFCLQEKYVNLIYEECPTMTEEIYIKYLQYLFNTSKAYKELIKYIDKDTINNLIEYKIKPNNYKYGLLIK